MIGRPRAPSPQQVDAPRSAESLDHTITLQDGRTLGFAAYGNPRGRPVLYCHGFPASRLEGRFFAPTAREMGLQMIVAERPGYGLSNPKAPGRIADWPDDAVQLADALGFERFAVLGVSGGGPYALACAWKLASRLTAVGIVNGLGPVYERWARRDMRAGPRFGFTIAHRAPRLLPYLYGNFMAKTICRRADLYRAFLYMHAAQADRKILERKEVAETLFASVHEALRRGAAGALCDFVRYANPWGFDLKEVDFPIQLWQGEADATVPASHARHQAAVLPRARACFFPDEGHFSLPVTRMREILTALAPSASSLDEPA